MGDEVRRAKVTKVEDAGGTPRPRTPRWVWTLAAGGAVAVVLAVAGVMALALVIQATAVQAGKAEDATREAIRWGDAANVGGVEVRVLGVEVAPWACQSESGKVATSDRAGLVIILQISTSDTTKTHQTNALEPNATLSDNFGQQLKPSGPIVSRGIGYLKVIGQLDRLEKGQRYTIRSDAPLTDKLIFNIPVEGAKLLSLKIARENYGGRGHDTFEIPDTAWKPKARR